MAVLRSEPEVRVNPDPDRVVVVGDLEIDVAAISVRCAGARFDLPLREFQVLLLLADNAGRVLSARSLTELVWDPGFTDVHGNLKVHVSRLRRRMTVAGASTRIRTIRGAGYCLDAA